MSRHRIIAIATLTMVTVGAGAVRAQLVISDPVLIARETAIAVLKSQILDTFNQQADSIQRMAARLSALTSLNRYVISDDDTPKWRIHTFLGEQFLYANPYDAALNYGDGQGSAFAQVARARADTGHVLATFGEEGAEGEAAILAELATLDAADSTIIVGTDQTGQLRYNGRQELAAIEALEGDTVDSSSTQGATAILDKISGAGLIRARQQQARIQFLAAITEQLIIDNKRSRDAEAATMNMQLERLRWGAAANTALVTGAADALRTWRQP